MTFTVLQGDALHLPLADGSVHCCVTSPPYWRLRDYGTPGQLGLEPTPEAYVANMVAVFREVWRVLRPDGTCWLNLGDSYNSSPSNQQSGAAHRPYHDNNGTGRMKRDIPGLKPKDLIGIPWRVALALQADGWWLRSDIVWAKGNPMPESVTDRPTKAHEYLFLLAKSARYFYDNEAIKEPLAESSIKRITQTTFDSQKGGPKDYGSKGVNVNRSARRTLENLKERYSAQTVWGDRHEGWQEWDKSRGRNKRSVWEIPTAPFPEAHFATFPPALVEPCIKAGTSERGCCPHCGAPWKRVVEKERQPRGDAFGCKDVGDHDHGQAGSPYMETVAARTLGWQPTCDCPEHEPVPCVVLDPFSGAGTTCLVADRLGRHGVGVELSGEYTRMARRRCYEDAPLLAYATEAAS